MTISKRDSLTRIRGNGTQALRCNEENSIVGFNKLKSTLMIHDWKGKVRIKEEGLSTKGKNMSESWALDSAVLVW